MNLYMKHVALPALAPVLIVGLYFTPLTVIGCLTRGIIAASIALVSAGLAFISCCLFKRLPSDTGQLHCLGDWS